MKVTSITIGASRTVNLGNYNSVKVEGSITMEILPSDCAVAGEVSTSIIHLITGEVQDQMEVMYRQVTDQDLPD